MWTKWKVSRLTNQIWVSWGPVCVDMVSKCFLDSHTSPTPPVVTDKEWGFTFWVNYGFKCKKAVNSGWAAGSWRGREGAVKGSWVREAACRWEATCRTGKKTRPSRDLSPERHARTGHGNVCSTGRGTDPGSEAPGTGDPSGATSTGSREVDARAAPSPRARTSEEPGNDGASAVKGRTSTRRWHSPWKTLLSGE